MATAVFLLFASTSVLVQYRGIRDGVVPQKGGQQQTGHYEVVSDWPKPLPDSEGKWTWGATQGIFAETPNKIFILQRGELPLLKRPVNTPVPKFGPSLSFPVNQTPFRNASQGPVASPPNENADKGVTKDGVDYRWRNCLFVVDSDGSLIESWTQWDKLFRRPHSIYISPYDPEKHVWVVDDGRHAIFKFTNDGKKLVQTIGTPNEPGADDRHFNRPTFLAWLPDGTTFLADGYTNTRVVKFDRNGKYLMAWGQKGAGEGPGASGRETRPGYFNTVHGIATDPKTRRVYVNDRSNRRIQVFDENGKFLDQWWIGEPPAHIYVIYMAADGYLWGADAGTWKLIKWDLTGKYLYSFGFQGDASGGLWGTHGITVDQRGNLYLAEVSNGRAQQFRPKKGADPTKLVGQPVRGVWTN
jgi:peptidylamidoglycolate lyase